MSTQFTEEFRLMVNESRDKHSKELLKLFKAQPKCKHCWGQGVQIFEPLLTNSIETRPCTCLRRR